MYMFLTRTTVHLREHTGMTDKFHERKQMSCEVQKQRRTRPGVVQITPIRPRTIKYMTKPLLRGELHCARLSEAD